MDNYRIDVWQDLDAINPREEYNPVKMFCFHKRYLIGDKHDYKESSFDSWKEFQEQLEKDYDIIYITPLNLYDHSGITLSTSSFSHIDSHMWDWGQVGFAFITRAMLEEWTLPLENLDVVVDDVVKLYNQWLANDIYGYDIYEKDMHVVSCGGFFGEEEAIQDAKNRIKSFDDKFKRHHLNQLNCILENLKYLSEVEQSLVPICEALKEVKNDIDRRLKEIIEA